jgi:hypothetical protein
MKEYKTFVTTSAGTKFLLTSSPEYATIIWPSLYGPGAAFYQDIFFRFQIELRDLLRILARLLASQPNPRLIEVDIEHLPSEKDSKRTGSCHRKNLIVISGGTFSIAFRISSVAFVSLSVSMLMPIPQPAQVICALALSRPMVCLSSCPQLGH